MRTKQRHWWVVGTVGSVSLGCIIRLSYFSYYGTSHPFLGGLLFPKYPGYTTVHAQSHDLLLFPFLVTHILLYISLLICSRVVAAACAPYSLRLLYCIVSVYVVALLL